MSQKCHTDYITQNGFSQQFLNLADKGIFSLLLFLYLGGNVINLMLFAKTLGSMWASTPTDCAFIELCRRTSTPTKCAFIEHCNVPPFYLLPPKL